MTINFSCFLDNSSRPFVVVIVVVFVGGGGSGGGGGQSYDLIINNKEKNLQRVSEQAQWCPKGKKEEERETVSEHHLYLFMTISINLSKYL